MKKIQMLTLAILLLTGCQKTEKIKVTNEEISTLENSYLESSIVVNIDTFHKTNDNHVTLSATLQKGTLNEDIQLSFVNSYGKIQSSDILITKYGTDEHEAQSGEQITLTLKNIAIEDIENSSLLFKE